MKTRISFWTVKLKEAMLWSLTLICGIILCTECNGEWKESLNWQYEYNASSGLPPEEFSTADLPVRAYGYQNKNKAELNFAGIASGTDGRVALLLRNDSEEEDSKSPVNMFAHYGIRLDQGFKGGNSYTIDCRVRLIGNEASPQFRIVALLPAREESRLAVIQISNTEIGATDGKKMTSKKIAIGNTWHDIRIHINLNESSLNVFLDGESSPALSGKLDSSDGKNYKIQFGDGSRTVKGSVEVDYFRFTSNDLIPVNRK